MNFTKIAFAVGSALGAQKAISTLQHFDVNDVLGTIGLERRRTASERILPTLGLIGLSAAIGAGAALLLAPSSGEELRTRLSGRLDDAKNRLDDAKQRIQQKVNEFERDQLAVGNGTTV